MRMKNWWAKGSMSSYWKSKRVIEPEIAADDAWKGGDYGASLWTPSCWQRADVHIPFNEQISGLTANSNEKQRVRGCTISSDLLLLLQIKPQRCEVLMISEVLGFRCPRWPLREPTVAPLEASCGFAGGFNARQHNSIISVSKVRQCTSLFPRMWLGSPSQDCIHWAFNIVHFIFVLKWQQNVVESSLFWG